MSQDYVYKEYIDSTVEIRHLSTLAIDGISTSDEYSKKLRENFINIGKLASKNKQLLDSNLFPILNSTEALTEEQLKEMIQLSHNLIDSKENSSIDLPILNLISDRIIKDVRDKNEIKILVKQLDAQMDISYALMNMTDRLRLYPEIADGYRKQGFNIGETFLSMLDPDKFERLNDVECQEIVLTDARYMSAFFEGLHNANDNSRHIKLLDRLLSISVDSYYRDILKEFDWSYFKFRTLNYYAATTEYCNLRKFNKEQLLNIYIRTEEYYNLFYSNEEYYKELSSKLYLELCMARNAYLINKLSKNEYLNKLIELYELRDSDDYGINGLYDNLLIPSEYIYALDADSLTEEQKFNVHRIYRNVLAYAFKADNNGSMSFMLEFITKIIDKFIEIPGSISFKDMMLQLLAALHPPTYIHSIMVAHITECLCKHLLKYAPEWFIGVLGNETLNDVKSNWLNILNFAHESALCHDFGKLLIIDTIFVYGRSLLDAEFNIIKTHPSTGAELALKYESTKAYYDVIIGHHKWYNNKHGYPTQFNINNSRYKIFIDLVHCADCMDAATDNVGRSYNSGKTLNDFIDEVKSSQNSRYAPWLVKLLNKEEVMNDIEYILNSGRQQIYKDTYIILRDIHKDNIENKEDN